jgi:hypothetical protein
MIRRYYRNFILISWQLADFRLDAEIGSSRAVGSSHPNFNPLTKTWMENTARCAWALEPGTDALG